MLRSIKVGTVLLILVAAGCGGATRSDYLQVFHDQKESWDELADILETVQDEKTMQAARGELTTRFARFEAVARRAKALPPPPADVLGRLEEERFVMQRATERLHGEVRRVQQLPGGEAFLKEFSGNVNAIAATQR